MDETNLSPIKRSALSMIDSFRNLVATECDDETIVKTLPNIKIPSVGIVEEDYMSYDDAIKELGMGYNRNKLSALAKKYNIQCHKFRNMPIGFHKDDIAKLKRILNNEE